MSDKHTPEPRQDDSGLPMCAQDECGRYDGKRCRLLGFRPGRFCEPALLDDYAIKAGLLQACEGALEFVPDQIGAGAIVDKIKAAIAKAKGVEGA